MKATAKKIEALKEMFAKYYELEEKGCELNERMFEDGKYKIDVHIEWCDNYDEMREFEKRIKRNVRTLADDLGFVIRKKDFESLVSTWKETFDDIVYQYDKAVKALHELGWCGRYSASLENKD